MSKHASGPWKWDDQELIAADGSIVCDDGSAYGEYCVRLHPASANARLIAAAPDLLEALEVAYMRLCDMICADDGHAWKEAEKAIPKIVAAIAKARGEA